VAVVAGPETLSGEVALSEPAELEAVETVLVMPQTPLTQETLTLEAAAAADLTLRQLERQREETVVLEL
jgi:hypothetical protein